MFRLLTELGFFSRPYDIHVYGDLTADPDVLSRMRFLHPVDLLISPNDIAWEQLALPQAIRGAALIHSMVSVSSFTTRTVRIATIFDDDLALTGIRRSAVVHRVKRAPVVVAISENTRERLIQSWELAPDRVVVIPAAPARSLEVSAGSARDSYLLTVLESHPRQVITPIVALRQQFQRAAAMPAVKMVALSRRAAEAARRQVERHGLVPVMSVVVPETSEALDILYQRAGALLTLAAHDAASLFVLHAFSVDCPVISAGILPDIDPTLYWDLTGCPLAQILTGLDTPAGAARVHAARNWATSRSWKTSAGILDDLYRRVLSDRGKL